MKDIIELNDGEDIGIFDAIVGKAGNVLSVQLGDLEYAQAFGIDKRFFLQSDFQFQNESFKAYLVQRLTESQVNVAQVLDSLEALYEQYTHIVGDVRSSSEGLIL